MIELFKILDEPIMLGLDHFLYVIMIIAVFAIHFKSVVERTLYNTAVRE